MNVRTSDIIKNEAINNLLQAQARIAEEGNTQDVIRITKFCIKMAERFNDEVVQIQEPCVAFDGKIFADRLKSILNP